MKQQDNLSFLNDIDKQIIAKDKEKYAIEMEINELQKKKEGIDADLMKLQNDKRVLGNAQYSNPMTRRRLIEIGATSGDINIRVAANSMSQNGLEKEKADILSDEMIDYMILLDKNYREISEKYEGTVTISDSYQRRDEGGGKSHDN